MAKLKEKRTILVVGATGHIGSCLTQQLLSSTDSFITILVRNEQRARELFDEGIRSGRIRLCLTQKLSSKDLLNALESIDIVVWCVGPKSKSHLLDLLSSSDSSKSVDYLAIQQLCDAVKQSMTVQRVIVIEPPEVGRPLRLRTILGNLAQNYLYYWKANGECLIKGSGIDYTIIRPHKVQSDQTLFHASVNNLSFSQDSASNWRLTRYPPISIASLTDVICATIERLDQTRRCTFEVTGEPSQATVWDDLFSKLQPDKEMKSKSLVHRHRIGIGIGITCSLLTIAGFGFAVLKLSGYDKHLSNFLNQTIDNPTKKPA